VPGVAPEALVHHQAGVGRVRFELRELEVAGRLEVDADGVEDDPDDLDGPQGRGLVGYRAHLDGQAHDPHEDALQAEHQPQALHPELVAPALAHGHVPGVLTLAVVADEEVDRQPTAPEGDHPRQQHLPAGHAVAEGVGHPGHEHEAGPPDDVHDGGVAQAQ